MTKEAIRSCVKAMGLVCFTIGAFGSVLVLPYALTNDLFVIATAGVYFIAGAVMMAGGLITYTTLMKDE